MLFALAIVVSSRTGWPQQHAGPVSGEGDQAVKGFSSNGDSQLNNYLRLALERNPGLGQALAQYRAALQRLPQVSALPDPMLAFTNYLRTPETRVGSQTNAITFSQQFPWFGTLGIREQVAAKDAARYRQQYEAARDQIVRQVKTAYYSLAFVDLAAEINGQERLLLDHYEQLAEARYQQGAGLQQAVVKLQAEITRVQNRLEELRSRRVDAEASLNALMNRPPETAVPRIKLPPVPAAGIDYSSSTRPGGGTARRSWHRCSGSSGMRRGSSWPARTTGRVSAWAGLSSTSIGRPVPPGAMPIDSNGMNVFSFNLGVSLPVHREQVRRRGCRGHGIQDCFHARLPGHGQRRRDLHSRGGLPYRHASRADGPFQHNADSASAAIAAIR